MTEREEFEAWVDSCIESEVGIRQALTTDDDGNYDMPWVSHCWMAWQAANALRAQGVATQTCETCRYFFTPSDNQRGWPSRCINPVVQELAYGRYFEPPEKFFCNKWEKT